MNCNMNGNMNCHMSDHYGVEPAPFMMRQGIVATGLVSDRAPANATRCGFRQIASTPGAWRHATRARCKRRVFWFLRR